MVPGKEERSGDMVGALNVKILSPKPTSLAPPTSVDCLGRTQELPLATE